MNFFNRSTPLPYVATYGFQCVTDTNCQEAVQVLVGGKLRCDAGKKCQRPSRGEDDGRWSPETWRRGVGQTSPGLRLPSAPCAVHSVAHCQLITGLCPDAVLRSPRLQQETMTDLGVSQMQSSFAYPHLAHSCSCLTALIELSQTGRGPRWFIWQLSFSCFFFFCCFFFCFTWLTHKLLYCLELVHNCSTVLHSSKLFICLESVSRI